MLMRCLRRALSIQALSVVGLVALGLVFHLYSRWHFVSGPTEIISSGPEITFLRIVLSKPSTITLMDCKTGIHLMGPYPNVDGIEWEFVQGYGLSTDGPVCLDATPKTWARVGRLQRVRTVSLQHAGGNE